MLALKSALIEQRAMPRPSVADVPEASRKWFKAPAIACPTLLLGVVASFSLITSLVLAQQGVMALGLAGVIVGLAHYCLFTVLHDSSHRAISSKYDWLNSRVGDVAGLLMFPVLLTNANFRYMHMQHHRFANTGSENDPDAWACGAPITLPFRWVTIHYRYIHFYLKHFLTRPRKEQIHIVLSSLAGATVIYTLIKLGWGETLFWAYVIPLHISFGFLALAFDWLPHYPHDVPETEDPYQATVSREGARWFLTPLLLGQNYHLLHHLYPRVPFYRYSTAWFIIREGAIEKGGRIVSPFGLYQSK